MPSYDTPDPIAVHLEVGVADVRITAGDRADTVVDVRPSDPADEADVAAAKGVSVDFGNGTLQVSGAKPRLFSRKTTSVDIAIELPTGSTLAVQLHVGSVRTGGRLGECTVTTAIGNVHLDSTGPLHLKTSAGHVSADAVDGDAEITTGSGRVRVGEVAGAATIDNGNGDTVIDAVAGAARLRAANGDLRLGRAGGDVDARTSNGSVRIDEVSRGSVQLATAMGDLEVGVAAGSAAWLDVNTSFGQVRRELDDAAVPESSDERVQVRARTSYGDIVVRRAAGTGVTR